MTALDFVAKWGCLITDSRKKEFREDVVALVETIEESQEEHLTDIWR